VLRLQSLTTKFFYAEIVLLIFSIEFVGPQSISLTSGFASCNLLKCLVTGLLGLKTNSETWSSNWSFLEDLTLLVLFLLASNLKSAWTRGDSYMSIAWRGSFKLPFEAQISSVIIVFPFSLAN